MGMGNLSGSLDNPFIPSPLARHPPLAQTPKDQTLDPDPTWQEKQRGRNGDWRLASTSSCRSPSRVGVDLRRGEVRQSGVG